MKPRGANALPEGAEDGRAPRSRPPRAALVQCPGWGRECPSYALACLAAYARREGFPVSCFDLNNACYLAADPSLRKMWEDKDYYSFWEDGEAVARLIRDSRDLHDSFAERILATGAKVVGFSVHTTSAAASLDMARRLKERDPSVLIVFGGPQCSRAQAAAVFAAEPCVDAVATGEGEAVLVELLERVERGEPLAPVPGLMVGREDGGDRPPIEDLDALPFPDYSDFAEDIAERRYASPERLEVFDSRGCVRRCHFCSEWQFWQRFRTMSGERIFSEIEAQIERFPQVRRIYFIGSLLNGAPRELERFCDLMIASKLRVSWEGQAIVTPATDERLLRKMARAGCAWLGFGIESGSERLRRAMNKPFTDDDAFRALRAAHDAGIRTQVNIMFGMPTETEEDFEDTLRFLVRNRPHIDSVLASQSFTVLDKHTELYEHPGRFGIEGREHHLYWTADEGKNDYAERFRRYEEFCGLALELGLPETSGLLRVKPDKWLLLGRYHRYRGDHLRAVRCLRRSMRLEPVKGAARAALDACYEALGRKDNIPAGVHDG